MKSRNKNRYYGGGEPYSIFIKSYIKRTELHKSQLSEQVRILEAYSKALVCEQKTAEETSDLYSSDCNVSFTKQIEFKITLKKNLLTAIESWDCKDLFSVKVDFKSHQSFCSEKEKIKQYLRKYEKTGSTRYLLLAKKVADEQRKLIFIQLEKVNKELKNLNSKYRLISINQWVHSTRYNIRNQNRTIRNMDDEDGRFTLFGLRNNVKSINSYSNDTNRKRILC